MNTAKNNGDKTKRLKYNSKNEKNWKISKISLYKKKRNDVVWLLVRKPSSSPSSLFT